MPRPVVSDAAEELYAGLGPWARADTARGLAADRWDLLELCEAAGGRLQPLLDIVRDSDAGPGWSFVVDADRAPEEWLGWAAQFAGKRLQQGLALAEQRARVKSTDGFDRGSPSAIAGAAQQYLTGTKTVYLVERHGSPYRLTITTVAAETPDPAAVLRAVIAQKPAGIVLSAAQTTGANYNALRDTHADYNEIKALYATYSEVLADPVKQ
jgi:hypothetical protein